jgi:hypothetical protein
MFRVIQVKAFQTLLKNCNFVVVDEGIFEFQPSHESKEFYEKVHCPIPVVYIVRKPHPNGLLVYYLFTKSSKPNKSYILDYQPKLNGNEMSPSYTAKMLVDRYETLELLHLTADVAFSVDVISQIQKKNGFYFTLSANKAHNPFLWNILYVNLNEHEHRFVLNDESGIITSVYQTNHSVADDIEDKKENKKKAHQLFTNLWKLNSKDLFRYSKNEPTPKFFNLSQYVSNKHQNNLLSDIIEEDLKSSLSYESEFDPFDSESQNEFSDNSDDEFEDSLFLVKTNSIKKTKNLLKIIFENESSLIEQR